MAKKTKKEVPIFAPVYEYRRVGTGDIPGLNACKIGDEWVPTRQVDDAFWARD